MRASIFFLFEEPHLREALNGKNTFVQRWWDGAHCGKMMVTPGRRYATYENKQFSSAALRVYTMHKKDAGKFLWKFWCRSYQRKPRFSDRRRRKKKTKTGEANLEYFYSFHWRIFLGVWKCVFLFYLYIYSGVGKAELRGIVWCFEI